jgi:hypothetical protein
MLQDASMTSTSNSLPPELSLWTEIAETLNGWCSQSTATTIDELVREKCQWPVPGDVDAMAINAIKVLLRPIDSFRDPSLVSRSLLKKMTLNEVDENDSSNNQEEGAIKESTSTTLRKQLQVQIALRLHLWSWIGPSFLQHYPAHLSNRKRHNQKKKKPQSNTKTTNNPLTLFEEDIIELLQQVAIQLPPELSLTKFIRDECGITPQHLKVLGQHLQFLWDAFEIQNPFVDPPPSSESRELPPHESARKRQRIKRTEPSKISQPNTHSTKRSPLLAITNGSLTAPARPSNPLLKDKTRFVGSHFNSQRTQNLKFCPVAADPKKRPLFTGNPTETHRTSAIPLRADKSANNRSKVQIAMSVYTTKKQYATLSSKPNPSTATRVKPNTPHAKNIFTTSLITTEHSPVTTSALVAEAMQALRQRRRRQQLASAT